MLKQTSLSTENKLRLYRGLMYTTTEIKGGLTPVQREQLHGLIAGQFPATDERLNRELALMLGYAGSRRPSRRSWRRCRRATTNQQLQLHYLYALRMIKQGWTAEQKAQLAELLGRAVEVARRRAVHQLRRPVLRLRSPTSTPPTRRSSCSTRRRRTSRR